MKAVFSPGPSYSDPRVRETAGWVRVFDIYREALEELGYKLFLPEVPPELIDGSSTVSKITSYDLVAASQLPLDADLFLGPPGYSLAQLMRLKGRQFHGPLPASDTLDLLEGKARVIPMKTPKLFLFVFNNADWWRDEQLTPEYQRFKWPYDLSPVWRWINKAAANLADHIIAPSPFVKNTWARVVPEERISIAFWGVDSQVFSPPPEEPPGFRVLFVGGDPVRKGLQYLGDAFYRLLDSSPGAELWIVGCSPDLRNLPPDRRRQVRVLGMVPFRDMPDIYRQVHVLVLPTLEDGIALCLQEAMASGVVPVATEDPAEVFEDGVSGIKIPYRDPGAILQALITLRDVPDRRREMARAARAKAEEQTWDQTNEAVKEIIRRHSG